MKCKSGKDMNARPPYLRHTLTAMTFSSDILFISISHPNKSEFLQSAAHATDDVSPKDGVQV